jgi:hypothetical protein
MDQFFTPTRRYHDLCELGMDDDLGPFEYTEMELAVPVEEFLVCDLDWKYLWAFLTGAGVAQKILWITEDAFLVVENDENEFRFHDDAPDYFLKADFQETSGREQSLILACASIDASIGVADVFWRAITKCNSIQVAILDYYGYYIHVGLPSGPILSKFLRESPSLQVLKFNDFLFDEEHCRALSTLQRTGLEIKLFGCIIDPQESEEGAFIEWFRHNQIVTELHYCQMGSRIISALSGNNSVKTLSLTSLTEENVHSLVQALPGNMGIEHLSLCDLFLSNESWSLLVSSLTTHPRIKRVSIFRTSVGAGHSSLLAESKWTVMNAILQMLQHNTVVETLESSPDYFEHEEVYQNSILPRLEMNRNCFEVQRQAVKRSDPSLRPQLLGRALHVVRFNPELVYLFLSENVPAFIQREDEEGSAIPLQNDPVDPAKSLTIEKDGM